MSADQTSYIDIDSIQLIDHMACNDAMRAAS